MRTSRSPETPLVDVLLRLIWQERAISRAELARSADLSRSTVSEAVSELLETGLVYEAGAGVSRGGRRPIVLAFRDDACDVIGVDMGATHITVVRTDLRGRILADASAEYPARVDPAGARTRITELIAACRPTGGTPARPLLGIGFAVPSPVDPDAPEALSTLALPAWKGRHGFAAIGDAFGAPIRVENDATLGALAERWWGGARGLSDFAFIKVATGVGSGHVANGVPLRGAHGVAGEIGHLQIDASGAPCRCGNRGCLVTFVGTEALERRAEALAAAHPDSPLAVRGAGFTRRLVQAAGDEDPLANCLVDELAERLGLAVASIANLFNPEAVIFGGGVATLGERLLDPLRATARHRTFDGAASALRVLASELEPTGIALGAATAVLDHALHDPSRFPALLPEPLAT